MYGSYTYPKAAGGYTSEFLLVMVMRSFWKLSRHQRAEKIACVATLAQVMRQMKNRRKKSREIQWVEFFATKSRTSSEGGYTGNFRRALVTRQFQKNRITIASKKLLV